MDTPSTLDQLASTDLRSIKELWLGGTHTRFAKASHVTAKALA